MKSPMATRAMSGCSLFHSSAYCPPLSAFLSLRFFQPRPSTLCGSLRLGHSTPRFRLARLVFRYDGSGRSHFAQSLVDSVMEELAEIRASRRIRASIKMGLPSSKDLFEVKLEKRTLQKGLLLEF